jgi:hypothetical protein
MMPFIHQTEEKERTNYAVIEYPKNNKMWLFLLPTVH